VNCPSCAGVGRFVDDGAACDGCDGTGYADETAQRVAVRLNAQVAAGEEQREVVVAPRPVVPARGVPSQKAWDFTPKGMKNGK
jgi:hypothetical protein